MDTGIIDLLNTLDWRLLATVAVMWIAYKIYKKE